MKTLPLLSTATPPGALSCALVAWPVSPPKPAVVPATRFIDAIQALLATWAEFALDQLPWVASRDVVAQGGWCGGAVGECSRRLARRRPDGRGVRAAARVALLDGVAGGERRRAVGPREVQRGGARPVAVQGRRCAQAARGVRGNRLGGDAGEQRVGDAGEPDDEDDGDQDAGVARDDRDAGASPVTARAAAGSRVRRVVAGPGPPVAPDRDETRDRHQPDAENQDRHAQVGFVQESDDGSRVRDDVRDAPHRV